MDDGDIIEEIFDTRISMKEKTTCLWFGKVPHTEEQEEEIKWNYAVDEIITVPFDALSDTSPGTEEDIKSDIERLDKVITDYDIRVFAGAHSLQMLCYLFKRGNECLHHPILIPQYVWDTESLSNRYVGLNILGVDRVYLSKNQARLLMQLASLVKEEGGCEFSLYHGEKEIGHGERGSINVKGYSITYYVQSHLRCSPFEEVVDGLCYHVTILRNNLIVGTLAGVEAKEAIQIITGSTQTV